MDKPTAIRTYLEEYHTGIDNAVFSRELERRFSLNGRSLRRIISYLRREGYPIGSSATGYFYAENKHEIDLTIHRLSALSRQIASSRAALLRVSVPEPTDNHTELEVDTHAEQI